GAMLVAVQMSLPRRDANAAGGLRAGPVELFGAGGVVGLLSSLVGIGGGSLSVPYLSPRGLPVHRAVGSAAAGGIPIASAGARAGCGVREPGRVRRAGGRERARRAARRAPGAPAVAGPAQARVRAAVAGGRRAHAERLTA